MLSRDQRLIDPDLFRAAVRKGRRAGGSAVTVHLLGSEVPTPAQVGFVVSKAVGSAVVRNRVKRRLRHLARELHRELPGSGVLVVRAAPAAASASYAELAADLSRCLERVLR